MAVPKIAETSSPMMGFLAKSKAFLFFFLLLGVAVFTVQSHSAAPVTTSGHQLRDVESKLASVQARLNKAEVQLSTKPAPVNMSPEHEARLAKMEAQLLKLPVGANDQEARIAKLEAQLIQSTNQVKSNANIVASDIAPQQQQPENAAVSHGPFQPVCTDDQRKKVSQVRPMMWTACPDATWLDDNGDGANPTNLRSSSVTDYPILFEPNNGRAPLGMYIGCNKGIDAVATLRFLSQDPAYDKDAWIKALDIANAKGVCGADAAPQSELFPDKQKPRPATIYCVEAMPSTFVVLKEAARKLNWEKTFLVHHGAASDRDGFIPFPNAAAGYEAKGMEDCVTNPRICQNVTMYSLDTFFREKVDPKHQEGGILDFLSIDVEGFDISVLRGGSATLQKTKYVEFEVHNKGAWKTVTVATAVTELKELNFACYYAGSEGRLWRLTDCMSGPGIQIFSNIACVNMNLAPNLARHMEDVFLKTIDKM